MLGRLLLLRPRLLKNKDRVNRKCQNRGQWKRESQRRVPMLWLMIVECGFFAKVALNLWGSIILFNFKWEISLKGETIIFCVFSFFFLVGTLVFISENQEILEAGSFFGYLMYSKDRIWLVSKCLFMRLRDKKTRICKHTRNTRTHTYIYKRTQTQIWKIKNVNSIKY